MTAQGTEQEMGFSMRVRVESNPSCHPGSTVARPSTSTSSGGIKKEKRVGDKKARVPLSPILIPNHSQHKAPRPRMSTAPPAARIGRHPRGVKLPTCPPRYRRLRQEAIVGGGEGGPGVCRRKPLTASQLTRVAVATAALQRQPITQPQQQGTA